MADARVAALATRSPEESRTAVRRLVEESRASARPRKDGERSSASPQAGSTRTDATSANPAPKTLVKSHVVVFAEGTDGHRGGGRWGVCWDGDSSGAKACAQAGCQKSDRKNLSCRTASTGPGGYCAIANASGFGASWPACSASLKAATADAVAGCSKQLKLSYGPADACGIVWSTMTR